MVQQVDAPTEKQKQAIAKAYIEYVKYGKSSRQTTDKLIDALMDAIIGEKQAAKIRKENTTKNSGGLQVNV